MPEPEKKNQPVHTALFVGCGCLLAVLFVPILISVMLHIVTFIRELL